LLKISRDSSSICCAKAGWSFLVRDPLRVVANWKPSAVRPAVQPPWSWTKVWIKVASS
jgi:hypothetical protein